jgi:hypothetical protein
LWYRPSRARLETIAADIGLSLSACARRVLLGRRVPTRDARPIPQVNQEAWTLLVQTHDSLQAIAERVAESDASHSWRSQVVTGIQDVAEALGPLRQAVLGVEEDV